MKNKGKNTSSSKPKGKKIKKYSNSEPKRIFWKWKKKIYKYKSKKIKKKIKFIRRIDKEIC